MNDDDIAIHCVASSLAPGTLICHEGRSWKIASIGRDKPWEGDPDLLVFSLYQKERQEWAVLKVPPDTLIATKEKEE